MKKLCLLLLSAFLIFGFSPANIQASQADLAESNSQFEQWTKNLGEFVKDVRFNEEDMQSFISRYDDFAAIGGESDEEEYPDFSTILQDKSYLTWAESNRLNSTMWLKKSMRIIAVMMRTEIEANSSEEQFDLQAQLEELEKMKDHIGEETYQEMKKAMAAGAVAMQGQEDSYRNLPVPTDTEKALLAKYNDQLMHLE